MSNAPPATAEFGSRAPSALWKTLIDLCHRPNAPLVSRLTAPIVRKLVLGKPRFLPVDLHLKEFNLRCQFTDNYSEKKFVFTPWRYDFQERVLLAESLSRGGTFVDIGANVGLYTLTAAKSLSGKLGRIIAFEPNPPTLARLQTNIEANPELFDESVQLDILPIGVADRELTFDLLVDGANLGASSIVGNNRSSSGEESKSTVAIHCRPLLDVLKELEVDRIDALKIDIEGAEDLALAPYLEQAPEALLAKSVFIENSQHLWSMDLFKKLESQGYRRVYVSRMNSVFSRS